MDNQIIRLNNDYTKQKMNEKNRELPPKRRHLGLILIVAMVAFSLASMSLVHAYQNLQKQVKLEQTAIKTHAQLSEASKTKQAEIKKLQDPDYLKKYARTKDYTEPGEKVFEMPNANSQAGQ